MDKYKLTYYPWITQHKSKEHVAHQIRLFADEVQKQLRKAEARITQIEVLPPMEVPEQIAAIVKGTCQIALMNPLGYVFAAADDRPVVAIAVAQREIRGKIGDQYFAQVYTNRKTAIRIDRGEDGKKGKRLDDYTAEERKALAKRMSGKSIGFGVSYSTSNFLVPAHELKKLGVHPLSAFSRVEYFGGHDLVAKAVYEGRVDLGAGHDGVIMDLADQYGYGDAKERLETLIESPPISSDPIAVLIEDARERAVLQQCLVAAGETTEGKSALGEFWGKVKGLAKPSAEIMKGYDDLHKSVKALAFEQGDLIKGAS